MPTYLYKCCEGVYEVWRSMKDESDELCPTCGEVAVRVYSSPYTSIEGRTRAPSYENPTYDFSMSPLWNEAQIGKIVD